MLAKHPEAKPQITAAAKPDSNTKPAQDRAALFAKKDKNNDGQLTRDEFLANQPDSDEAPKRFQTFDIDNNGVLSREEFITAGKPKK